LDVLREVTSHLKNRNSDVMIVTGLSLKPQFPPEAMVQELCNLVGASPQDIAKCAQNFPTINTFPL